MPGGQPVRAPIMTFDLNSLLVFAIAAVLYAGLLSGRWRGWALLLGSALGVYWLQPNLAPRFASYALQTGTIAITILMWALSRQRDDEAQQATWREDRLTLLALLLVVFGVALLRFFARRLPPHRLPSTRPANGGPGCRTHHSHFPGHRQALRKSRAAQDADGRHPVCGGNVCHFEDAMVGNGRFPTLALLHQPGHSPGQPL
ncbi:MAG: hypothetical protein M5U34_26140 [Chloroflexi bacterium]|nr:hypothetical protein [Chloroflexota bacterium]